MATLRDIKRRIRSVQNTQQITKAMEMVAASKLRRAQSRVLAARPYARGMDAMLENLAPLAAEAGHPLFAARPVARRLLVVMGADRGLCGSYNANLFRTAESHLRSTEGRGTRLFLLGRKARARAVGSARSLTTTLNAAGRRAVERYPKVGALKRGWRERLSGAGQRG